MGINDLCACVRRHVLQARAHTSFSLDNLACYSDDFDLWLLCICTGQDVQETVGVQYSPATAVLRRPALRVTSVLETSFNPSSRQYRFDPADDFMNNIQLLHDTSFR